jgi:hypothetical protein
MFSKLERGLIQILTHEGPVYVAPSLFLRIYLMWVFRHFTRLPHGVLSRKARKHVEVLMSVARCSAGLDHPCLIGTVELPGDADVKRAATIAIGELAWSKR